MNAWVQPRPVPRRHAAMPPRVVAYAMAARRADPCRPPLLGFVLACENVAMARAPKRIRLSEPGVAGSYELVERRADGSLVLRPETELLSDLLRETEGAVFRDEDFAAHLERVAASEDDLPPDGSGRGSEDIAGNRLRPRRVG